MLLSPRPCAAAFALSFAAWSSGISITVMAGSFRFWAVSYQRKGYAAVCHGFAARLGRVGITPVALLAAGRFTCQRILCCWLNMGGAELVATSSFAAASDVPSSPKIVRPLSVRSHQPDRSNFIGSRKNSPALESGHWRAFARIFIGAKRLYYSSHLLFKFCVACFPALKIGRQTFSHL
jgi:hypothetical protein